MVVSGGSRLWAAFFATVVLAGCGGDSGEQVQPRTAGSGALDLVRLLPQDADTYSTVDLTALKGGLAVPASANPYSDRKLISFTSATLNGVYAGVPKRTVVDALELPSATALAFSSGGFGEDVTAVATPVDLEQVREALLALGFVDRGGVLEGPDGKRAVPERREPKTGTVQSGAPIQLEPPVHGASAVRLEDGGFLISDNGELLRSLGSQASELPLRVLNSLEGDATNAFRGVECIREEGIATSADGSGELIFALDGRPDPKRFSGLDSPKFGEPAVSGNQLIVPIELDRPEPPLGFLAITLPGYDC